MDDEAQKFLKAVGIDSVNPSALYVLIRSTSGILLEDLAPLIASLEITYRRLFTLYLDTDVRKLLGKRYSESTSLRGVTRSINAKYRKLMVPKDEEYTTLSANKTKQTSIEVQMEEPPVASDERSIEEFPMGGYGTSIKFYAPHRIELARSKISSPGFLEFLGDPNALTHLFALLGWLLAERKWEKLNKDNQLLASRESQRDNVSSLLQLGYSKQDIENIADYLKEDLSTILKVLRETGSQIAPGEQIDPGNFMLDAPNSSVNGHGERD